VVLYGRRGLNRAVGDERLDRKLLADESLFDYPLVEAGLAHVLDRLRLGHLVAGHSHPFSAGESARFDCDVSVILANVICGRVCGLERLEVWTARDGFRLHELSLVGFVRLDACFRCTWAKRVHTCLVQPVSDPRFKRGFRPNHRQCGVNVHRHPDYLFGGCFIDNPEFRRQRSDTRILIARAAEQFTVGRNCPGNRVFSSASTHQ
jgi:hypothetical protein